MYIESSPTTPAALEVDLGFRVLNYRPAGSRVALEPRLVLSLIGLTGYLTVRFLTNRSSLQVLLQIVDDKRAVAG